MTEAQAEVYRYLKRQKKPKTPGEVGKAIKKTGKAAWRLLDELKKRAAVAKTNDHKPDPPKGQGKYYVPGSSADPEHDVIKRLEAHFRSDS